MSAATLQTSLDNLDQRIADVTASPKPSYSVDGENVQWTEYLQMLTSQRLVLAQAVQSAGGPFEIRTIGRSGGR